MLIIPRLPTPLKVSPQPQVSQENPFPLLTLFMVAPMLLTTLVFFNMYLSVTVVLKLDQVMRSTVLPSVASETEPRLTTSKSLPTKTMVSSSSVVRSMQSILPLPTLATTPSTSMKVITGIFNFFFRYRTKALIVHSNGMVPPSRTT